MIEPGARQGPGCYRALPSRNCVAGPTDPRPYVRSCATSDRRGSGCRYRGGRPRRASATSPGASMAGRPDRATASSPSATRGSISGRQSAMHVPVALRWSAPLTPVALRKCDRGSVASAASRAAERGGQASPPTPTRARAARARASRPPRCWEFRVTPARRQGLPRAYLRSERWTRSPAARLETSTARTRSKSHAGRRLAGYLYPQTALLEVTRPQEPRSACSRRLRAARRRSRQRGQEVLVGGPGCEGPALGRGPRAHDRACSCSPAARRPLR